MENSSKEEQQHRDYISLLEELLEAGDETGELHLQGKLLHDSVKRPIVWESLLVQNVCTRSGHCAA